MNEILEYKKSQRKRHWQRSLILIAILIFLNIIQWGLFFINGIFNYTIGGLIWGLIIAWVVLE